MDQAVVPVDDVPGSPVRIQWDPKRDILLRPLEHRAIQIGLSNEAVELYASKWIRCITDVTSTARAMHGLVKEGQLDRACSMLPVERSYPLTPELARLIGAT